MKFKGKFDADCFDGSVAGSRSNAMSCAGKRKSRVEEDLALDDDYLDGGDGGDDLDDLDTDSLLDQFDDDIEGVDLSDLDLEDFADEFGDDDLDDLDDDYDDDDSPRGKRRRDDDDDDDIDDDDIDDSAFYNDEFKDFDNYTTISDFDDDLDSYIQNEDGGFYDDYDSRY
ncbi:MAG: hypothetical protein IJ894_00235 [Bacteroidales bacterium]|jgi:hypothetical protein|nr:hypothetical protein [Bacteroidales bacterium]MBR2199168.1 hypothetical protein [Bacteroidales bacterium]MBR3711891.1 hypothetical protein [Bacteroidales bacterium]